MLSFAPRFNFGSSSNSGGAQNSGGGANATGEDSAKRSSLVGQILAFNSTASAEFLAQFDCTELGAYLEHLESASRPRGRMARRVRPANTPGITNDWRS